MTMHNRWLDPLPWLSPHVEDRRRSSAASSAQCDDQGAPHMNVVNPTVVPVILSGGSGTRLWPMSRELFPKQLLPLVGKGTMLQETLARLAGVPDVGAPLVVCNESHRFL